MYEKVPCFIYNHGMASDSAAGTLFNRNLRAAETKIMIKKITNKNDGNYC